MRQNACFLLLFVPHNAHVRHIWNRSDIKGCYTLLRDHFKIKRIEGAFEKKARSVNSYSNNDREHLNGVCLYVENVISHWRIYNHKHGPIKEDFCRMTMGHRGCIESGDPLSFLTIIIMVMQAWLIQNNCLYNWPGWLSENLDNNIMGTKRKFTECHDQIHVINLQSFLNPHIECYWCVSILLDRLKHNKSDLNEGLQKKKRILLQALRCRLRLLFHGCGVEHCLPF